MAVKLTIPDTIRPFLKATSAKGVYSVKDPAAWLNRRFAKVAPLSVTVLDGDDKQRFGSRILGLHKTKNEFSLIIDNLVPIPDASFYAQPKKVQIRMNYVEWGFEVISLFAAVAQRRVMVKDNPAVQITNIEDVKVSVGTYTTSLGRDSGVELGLFVRGGFIEARPERMSLTRIWFSGNMPDDVGDEGLTIEKAVIKLGEEEGDTLTIRLQAFPDKSGTFEGRLLDMEHVTKLANFIERRWSQQAKRLAEEKGEGKAPAPSSVVPEKQRKVDDYLKPHYFLLGEDQAWVDRLNEFGLCVPVTEKEPDKVIAKLDETRCDMIVGDADSWDTGALVIAQMLRSHDRYSQVPLVWIAGKDNIFAENGGQDLIDLGAYDFIDRTIEAEEIERSFVWANPKTKGMGDGPRLCIVSPANRMQYRFGKALNVDGIRIVKVDCPEAKVASKLLENDARWILIDGPELGDALQNVLKSSLDWAQRGDDPRDLFLVEQGLSPEEIDIWKQAGVAKVIPFDPSLETVISSIKPRLGPSPEEETS